MTSERDVGTVSEVSYSAVLRATADRIVRPATVWTLSMSWFPGTKSTVLPISVARPTASSTAVMAAIFRM
ncbi:MAG: hypothetical protein FD129_432 [bacterium]|nr:MAG: hypothetical protein FD129_432 [bacterium]